MSLESLIVCVATNALQFYEFITENQFYGVTNGSNTVASNAFTVPLRLLGGRPDNLKDAMRNLSSTLGELIGYLSRNDQSTPYARLNLQFLKYSGCVGLETGSYIMRMAKYRSGSIYGPLAKYFAIEEGVGPRPCGLSPVLPLFSSIQIPAQGDFAGLVVDGDGVILVSRGAPVEVDVPPELAGFVLSYDKVTRTAYGDLATSEDGLNGLSVEVSGVLSTIPRAGLLDFNRPALQLANFAGTKALKFGGVFYSVSDEDMWLGNYPPNDFDGDVFLSAMAKMRIRGGAHNHIARINQIWSRSIRSCRDLTAASQNLLTGFNGFSIFSEGAMTHIRAEQSYAPGRAGSGKVYMAKLLSMLYSLYVIMVISEALNM